MDDLTGATFIARVGEIDVWRGADGRLCWCGSDGWHYAGEPEEDVIYDPDGHITEHVDLSLRDRVAALIRRAERAEAEAERLERTLAVELSQWLPDGWERDDDPVSGLHYAVEGRWDAWTTWDAPGRYRWGVEDLWRVRPGLWRWGGVEGSMLGAVEAAEAQMREADDV